MKTMLSIAMVMLVACGGDDGGSSGDDGGGSGHLDAGSGSDQAQITAGQYEFSNYNPSQDTCAGAVDGDGPVTISLVSGGFKVAHDNGISSQCTLSGKHFTCTTAPEVRTQGNATQSAALLLSGDITTPTLISVDQTIDITCSGSDCADIDPAACKVVVENAALSKV